MRTCSYCILAVVVLVVLVGGLLARRTPRPSSARESFGFLSTILDERCRLNRSVSVDVGLGLVRHPTDSHSGSCVVRGGVPGNGVCDETNAKLFDRKFVSSVKEEKVDGRRECVLRMHQALSDHDARTYGHSLQERNIEESTAFKSINNDRIKCSNDNAILSADLEVSHNETSVAKDNWRDQIESDAAALKTALQQQREDDASILAAAIKKRSEDDAVVAGQAVADARTDEKAKGQVIIRLEQGKQAGALRDEQRRSTQAVRAAVASNTQSLMDDSGTGMQGLKDAQYQCVRSLSTQAQDEDAKLKQIVKDADTQAHVQADLVSKAKGQVTVFAQLQAQFQAQTQELNDARGQAQSQSNDEKAARDSTQSQTNDASASRGRAQAFEQAVNDTRGNVNNLRQALDQARAQLDAEKGQWMTIDGNLSGNDYARASLPIKGCQERCKNDAQCTHYSWQTSGNCFLKQGRASNRGSGYWSFLSVGKYNH